MEGSAVGSEKGCDAHATSAYAARFHTLEKLKPSTRYPTSARDDGSVWPMTLGGTKPGSLLQAGGEGTSLTTKLGTVKTLPDATLQPPPSCESTTSVLPSDPASWATAQAYTALVPLSTN